MAKLANSMPHVVILLESTYPTHTQILRGILRFTQLHAPWTLPPELSALIRRHRTPTIVMNDIGREVRPIARILCDNAAIARLAAETLAGKGFENFAFVGERSGIHWSVARERVFADEIARRGFPCRVYPTDEGGGAEDGRRLQDWLRALPRPTALFAAYDIRARQVLDACHAAGLAVPDDIAILGVDDDEVICETAAPALSSIPLSMADAGFRAAELLDRVMSTGADALVRRCRALMEANVGRPFNVADLVASLGVSRRTLETRFRAATGRSLNDEITELRIRRAKTMLAKSALPQSAIAAACGFCDASHLNVIFRRHCGAPPSAFRENK